MIGHQMSNNLIHPYILKFVRMFCLGKHSLGGEPAAVHVEGRAGHVARLLQFDLIPVARAIPAPDAQL